MASALTVATQGASTGAHNAGVHIAPTLNQAIQDSVRRFPTRPALSAKRDGAFRPMSYAALASDIQMIASALNGLGIHKGDRVAILSENGMNWARIDLATLAIGAVVVPIYPTLPANQVSYMLRDSGAKAVFAGDAMQLAKVKAVRADCPDLEEVVLISGAAEGGVRDLDSFIALGRDFPLTDDAYKAAWSGVTPDDLATIIYTSGTTGDPKGVELTHGNFMNVISGVPTIIPWDETDIFLSFLPLCHIYERAAGYYLALTGGSQIVYVEGSSSVERIAKLPLNFVEVKPTIFLGMPRLYEKMKEKIEDAAAKAGPKKKKVFDWAIGVGLKAARIEMRGGKVDRATAIQRSLADKLVLHTVRERFGGRIRYLVSAGAPLAGDVMEFFHACGLMMIEGYGLTETSSLAIANRANNIRPNSVGLPGDNNEIRIAEDGEILCRGGNVMRGYWRKPEATAEAITADGWFHTGDLGTYIEDGFIRITGRKKDLIVLSNGKKVAPQDIEANLKTSPYITDLALMGDGSQSVVALIVPAFDRLQEENGAPMDRAALASDPEVRRFIKKELDRLSVHLADFEKVRKFALMDHEFSIENGELTPTLKVKRHVLTARYKDILADLMN
ncbi:MAG TPA: long-chain fatty acid--CoA ligase [Armatimonadota bacterium]|jgi:long-chain acyl-CoA synthetase